MAAGRTRLACCAARARTARTGSATGHSGRRRCWEGIPRSSGGDAVRGGLRDQEQFLL